MNLYICKSVCVGRGGFLQLLLKSGRDLTPPNTLEKTPIKFLGLNYTPSFFFFKFFSLKKEEGKGPICKLHLYIKIGLVFNG
jgi:hypothetical protein